MSSIRSTYAYALDKAPKATFARTGLGVLLELVIVAGELADADPNEMCTRLSVLDGNPTAWCRSDLRAERRR